MEILFTCCLFFDLLFSQKLIFFLFRLKVFVMITAVSNMEICFIKAVLLCKHGHVFLILRLVL